MPTSLEYASELIRFDSVSTKTNVPVTECVEAWLRNLKFDTERIDYVDNNGIPKSNVIGKLGSGTGGVAYFGHTDVVPAVNWKFDDHGPFEPTIRDGKLYGRGSTDMKGSVACMLAAAEQAAKHPLKAPIYICCTADEEVGMIGARHLAERSAIYREIVEGESRSIVGEPTRFQVVYAHKGGCMSRITARGIAAHSSTTKGVSANWKMIPFLAEMKALHDELETEPRWRNPEFDPPTMTMNLTINDNNPALNVTAAQSICQIYFRAMPGTDVTPLIDRIQKAAETHGLECTQTLRATPFYVDPQSPYVQECLDFSPSKSPRTVSYGTDASRFHELKNCIVMGPGDIAQAHTFDEWIKLDDLEQGTMMYQQMLQRWCVK